jgi:PTS system nitrogen regulatory IIA component
MLRVDAGMSLAELARTIGVSPAYLSRVEHGHDAVPTPDRIVAIAKAIDVPALVLLEIAQGAGTALASYLERVPEASTLFLEMARREFGAAEIGRLKAFMDRALPVARRGQRARLADVLSPPRVVVRAVCHDLDDLVALSATRLEDAETSARALAEHIGRREDEAPSFMGYGVVAPHAIVPGGSIRAALVIMARAIRTRAPDGVPVRLGIVLVAPTADRHHLELLAHIARLATRGIADTIGDARTAEQALSKLAGLDVS